MDEIQLRNLYGPATEKASAKIMKSLDPHSVSFINASNFLVMGTFDGVDIDLSPKGDPKGFVKVISNDRIEIADRPGNNRIDALLHISKNATVGVYYWKKGSDYVNCAETMIKKNIRVNNEFYVCPVYNEAISDGKKIVIDKVSEMHGLGTPDDLKNFITKKNLVN